MVGTVTQSMSRATASSFQSFHRAPGRSARVTAGSVAGVSIRPSRSIALARAMAGAFGSSTTATSAPRAPGAPSFPAWSAGP